MDLSNAYNSVWMKVMFNIVNEFGIAMKIVRIIQMCLNEIYSRVRVGRHLCDMFPVNNGMK
jgi:hypothetical protein